MGKQVIHSGGKDVSVTNSCSSSRGKTSCLEISKVKRMGFKVFTFKQRAEDGDAGRVRYIYASDEETVICRRELLKRLRDNSVTYDLSLVIDDDVFGDELVNDVEVATAVASDDATSDTMDTASMEPSADDDYVMLVPTLLTDEECDLISRLPDPDDVPGGFKQTCLEADKADEQGDEEGEFFSTLSDWVYDESTSQCASEQSWSW